jgi:hypothetical protein
MPVDNVSPNIPLGLENMALVFKSKLIEMLTIRNVSVLYVSPGKISNSIGNTI